MASLCRQQVALLATANGTHIAVQVPRGAQSEPERRCCPVPFVPPCTSPPLASAATSCFAAPPLAQAACSLILSCPVCRGEQGHAP